jgi:hypothetical protein
LHAPAGAAVDGQPAGSALDHDEDIAAVAGTAAVPGQLPSVGADTEALPPQAVGPQPGAGGKLLLTVHDGAAGPAGAAAVTPQLAGDSAQLDPVAGGP